MQPKVTVCITSHNRPHTLELVVNSVINQTYKKLEILIIDDASEKRLQKEINKIAQKDKRISLIKHKKNLGLAAARNTAIKHAKGKYISFLDDDDYWYKDFISEFVKTSESYNSNYCFCCGYIVLLKNKSIKSIPYLNGLLKDYIMRGYTPPVSSQFYFLSSLKKVGGYNENIKSGVDHDIWLRLSFNKMKIKSVIKALSYPNRDPGDTRITTSHHDRFFNISESLQVWKQDLVSNYGMKFFQYFKSSYFYYLNKKKVLDELQKRNFNTAFKLALSSPQKKLLLTDIIKGSTRGFIIRYNLLFRDEIVVEMRPTFPKFK